MYRKIYNLFSFILTNKYYITIEFTILFIILPVSLAFFRNHMRRMVIPILGIACILIFFILFIDNSFKIKRLWNVKNFHVFLGKVIVRFILGGIVLGILVYFHNSNLLMSLPRRNIKFWMIIMVLYPLLSAYPQEVIYRLFFFHRYKTLFVSSAHVIIMSGVCFGLAHLFFLNFWAVILSSLGGFLFAYTYSKSDSVIITAIEHGLWGDLIFTLGLGIYFYSGNI